MVAATAGSTAHAAPPASAPSTSSAALDLTTWGGVRAAFDGLAPHLVHMAGFFLASHPRPVREAIEAHRRGLDESPLTYIEHNVDRAENDVRAAASAYLGVPADSLAMTGSTTMGLGTVYTGLRLRAGHAILSSEHDHPATRHSLDYCAARTGATVQRIRLYQDPAVATTDEIVGAIARALTPATRLVALTWVHSSTGVRLPLDEIAAAIARANVGRAEDDHALLAVDGVHGIGVEDVNLPDLGCDFFIAGCHKWLFGPRGTGFVYGTPAAWALTSPTIPTFDGMWRGKANQPLAASMTPGGFHAFEHRWALAEAFRFHLAIGKSRVAGRITALNRQLKEGLARMSHVKLHTPLAPRLSAGINCFEVEHLTPIEAKSKLRAKGVIASVSPYEPPYLRLAPSLITDERDVDKALAAVRGLG